MNCNEDKSVLSAYHDGEISGQRLQEVEEHLESCAACRRRLERWEEVEGVLEKQAIPRPSPDLGKKIINHLKRERYAPHLIFFPLRKVAAAAMLLVGILTGALIGINFLALEPAPREDSVFTALYFEDEEYERVAGEDPVNFYYSLTINNDEGAET